MTDDIEDIIAEDAERTSDADDEDVDDVDVIDTEILPTAAEPQDEALEGHVENEEDSES